MRESPSAREQTLKQPRNQKLKAIGQPASIAPLPGKGVGAARAHPTGYGCLHARSRYWWRRAAGNRLRFQVISDNVVFRIPELALGIPNVWNGTPLLAREVGLPTARDWVMTTRNVFADELKQSGWAQRVAVDDSLEALTGELLKEPLDVPAAALAMTRSMTSALGRSAAGMSLG